MKRLGKIFTIFTLFTTLGLFACFDDSSDDSSALTALLLGAGSSGGLSTYLDDVKACTPNLASSRVIEQWINAGGTDGWSSNATYGVLKKLFHPDSGTESIYGPIENVDRIIGFINDFSGQFNENGAYSVTNGLTTLSATVGDLPGGVTSIPYFGGPEANVDRLITVIGTGEYNINLKAAFGVSGDNEYLVFRSQNAYESGGSTQTEYTICHASRNNSTGVISVELASICDKDSDGNIDANPSTADDFLIRYKFIANTTSKTFKFTQKTNAGTGWCVMGGGSVAEDSNKIAVRATDSADSAQGTNDHSNLSSTAGYYIILTKALILDPTTLDSQGVGGTTSGGWPKQASAANIAGESDSEKNHIDTTDATNCLGWTNEYPDAITDLLWP